MWVLRSGWRWAGRLPLWQNVCSVSTCHSGPVWEEYAEVGEDLNSEHGSVMMNCCDGESCLPTCHSGEEGPSSDKLSPWHWPVGKTLGRFPDSWLIQEAHPMVGSAIPRSVDLDYTRKVTEHDPGSKLEHSSPSFVVSAPGSCVELLPWLPSTMNGKL